VGAEATPAHEDDSKISFVVCAASSPYSHARSLFQIPNRFWKVWENQFRETSIIEWKFYHQNIASLRPVPLDHVTPPFKTVLLLMGHNITGTPLKHAWSYLTNVEFVGKNVEKQD
jgi:hypothetical protein